MAYTWADPATMTVAVNVNTNASGNIATGSDAIAGTKTFSLNGIAKTATYAQAQTVLNKFIGDIASGTYVESSAVRTIKSGVVETA